ncbi:putative kelch-type beta propeller [Helianthus annuus]|nr:putative DCD domain-containing protein NRP [Helianthus annuus]KAJ0922532.1 putative kelch-type beta propeller [Helianthus annuus]
MLDFDVGAWIPARSMLEKWSALGAAELNGALYAVAERFDPKEGFWKKTESMSTRRGCPSMVVLNEKLYVLGGYDGNRGYDGKTMLSIVEIYDPRRGSWVFGKPMNSPQGCSATAVTKDSIYIIGGLKSGDEINDTVECYKEGRGWEMTNTNDAYRRCFLSAMAL